MVSFTVRVVPHGQASADVSAAAPTGVNVMRAARVPCIGEQLQVAVDGPSFEVSAVVWQPRQGFVDGPEVELVAYVVAR